MNGDGLVNAIDFNAVIGSYGILCTCPEDVNGDGSVNAIDFNIVVGSYGASCN
ncbi:MAG: hypothetical protein HC896_06255 [Bacteroidales bacterium]|nr:hypothetical protein [Bacteroidales bacterium]